VSDDSLDVDELGSRIVGLAGRLAAATCRWLLLVAAFDARDGAARFGLPSTARWLGHYCGLSRRTTRDHVRVARALAAHACLAEAMSAGRISYSHVRAISRVAELGDDKLVADLVMVAEHGTVDQVEDTVRGLRSVDDNNRGRDERDPETVSHRWRPDSRWGLSAALDPEHGALVQSAIETVARREGITQAEALTRMAEIALAAMSSTEQPAPSLRGDEYAATVIQLDAAAIPPETTATEGEHTEPERGSAEPPWPRPYARIQGGPGLPDAVVKRLLCSGRIRTVVTEGRDHHGTCERHNVLDLGRSHRLVARKRYRALALRDGGCCAHPCCGSTIGLEAHHVRHWLYGGRTDLDNLVLLCRRHHHAHHNDEFRIIALGHGRFRFLRADGAEIPVHVDPSRLAATRVRVEDEHDDVYPDTATTRWDGTRLDHDYAIAALAQGLHSVNRLRNETTDARQTNPYDPWAVPARDIPIST
jgi:hypothetical protein